MIMGIIRREGYDFCFDPDACKDCFGYCCRGESGNIWVNQQEILQISSFLKINSIDFILKYLNRIGNRFSIKERVVENCFECIFFQGPQKRCSIYTIRPYQCRCYPFWDYFKSRTNQLLKECPGVRCRVQGELT